MLQIHINSSVASEGSAALRVGQGRAAARFRVGVPGCRGPGTWLGPVICCRFLFTRGDRQATVMSLLQVLQRRRRNAKPVHLSVPPSAPLVCGWVRGFRVCSRSRCPPSGPLSCAFLSVVEITPSLDLR